MAGRRRCGGRLDHDLRDLSVRPGQEGRLRYCVGMSTAAVTHSPAESRFVVSMDDDVVGYLSYEIMGGTADLQHTVVDPAHRHHGLGAMLVEEALRTFRADRMMVRPTCPFVADFIAEHEEYQNLLAPSLTVEDTGERS
ncbi:GNAT family N-acetyltransferase [Ornithinimicrobium cerasi]